MSGPMILNDNLNNNSLNNVQNIISKFINEPISEEFIPDVERCPEIALPIGTGGDAATENKYKICVIEKEQIKFPEQTENSMNGSSNTDNEVKEENDGCFIDVSNKNEVNSSSMEADINYNLGTQQSKLSNGFREVPSNPNAESNDSPNTEKVDDEVMGRLFDYYRKFNEKQLGLEVSSDIPTYSKGKKPPAPVICDNIIKEAVIRVNENHEPIKEPTIDESEHTTEQIFDVYAMYSKIETVNKEHEMAMNCNKARDDNVSILNDLQCKDRHNYGDEWRYGANFIEKALQRRIDEGKKGQETSKKWDKNDIVKLVEMLSKKRDKSVKRPEREWSSRGAGSLYQDCRDDLLDQLEQIDAKKEYTLFDQLKETSFNDDSLELEQLLVENCNPHHNDKVIHSRHNVYHGGNELDIFKDYIKSAFNFSWLWNTYDKVVGKCFDGYQKGANGGIASGYDANSNWFRWKIRLNRVKSMSTWLSRGWFFGKKGKPIYKQVEYEKTNVITWQEKYASEIGDANSLKKRRLRNLPEETIIDLEGTSPSAYEKSIYTESFGEEGERLTSRYQCRASRNLNDTVIDLGG